MHYALRVMQENSFSSYYAVSFPAQDILKYTERAGLNKEVADLMKAVLVMNVVPKMANDMMNVGRLQGFDGKITAQGKLLKQVRTVP